MSRALRQKINRLKADAAPVIAPREQRQRGGNEHLRRLSKQHLLRVIAVHRYGDPKIDEPLERAYARAMLKLGCDVNVETNIDVVNRAVFIMAMLQGCDISEPEGLDEELALTLFENMLENEQPDRDINSILAAAIKEVPDWLLFLTNAARASGDLLGIDVPDAPDSFFGLAPENAEDLDIWPNLPKGVLKRYSEANTRAFYRNDAELAAYTAIMLKPKANRTRREIEFIRSLCYRNGVDPSEVLNTTWEQPRR